MANTARDFHKKKMEIMKDSELWNIIHESPAGLMATPSSKDKMFAAIELLDERQEVYRAKVDFLEERMNNIEASKKVSVVSQSSSRRGRPRKVVSQ